MRFLLIAFAGAALLHGIDLVQGQPRQRRSVVAQAPILKPAPRVAPATRIDPVAVMLRAEIQSLRWDVDDLLILNRPDDGKPENLANPKSNTVIVSGDYPEDRIPAGVKIDDQRPPDKRGRMLYLSVKLKNGKEERVYPPVVEWRGNKEK